MAADEREVIITGDTSPILQDMASGIENITAGVGAMVNPSSLTRIRLTGQCDAALGLSRGIKPEVTLDDHARHLRSNLSGLKLAQAGLQKKASGRDSI